MLGLRPTEVLTLLADEVARCGVGTSTIGGSIRFDVVGGGDWTLWLDEPGGRWSTTRAGGSADVTVVIPAEHFATLLAPGAPLAALLASGEVQVNGAAHKLAALGDLLSLRTTSTRARLGRGGKEGRHARARR